MWTGTSWFACIVRGTVTVVVATAVRWLLNPYLDGDYQYVTYFPSIFLCGFFWGFRGAVVANLMACSVLVYFIFIEKSDHQVVRQADLIGLGFFCGEGLLVGILCHQIQRRQRLLLEADISKNDLIATVAHELRNPLSPMKTAIRMIRMAFEKGIKLDERSIAIIERQLVISDRLVEDLLDVTRIVRGTMVLDKRKMDLVQLIRILVETIQLSDEKAHRVEFPVPQQPIWINGDSHRLTQVFNNLMVNALKFTPRGGCISVTLTPAGNQVFVSVVDNGIGIDNHNLNVIFDMFSQVASDDPLAMKGLGIGLNLTKRLVELHSGKIEAYSPGKGKGSEFVVRLPSMAHSC